MDKKIGLFWLRDDFRLSRNNGLIEATINHDEVVVFYLYKKHAYENQVGVKKIHKCCLESIQTISVDALFKANKQLSISTPLSYLYEESVKTPCLFDVFLIDLGSK